MIESNQLRLGNWVLLDWENTYRRINLNTLCYITRSEKLGKKHPFKPIPLTEEILLKCGFEKKEGLFVFNNVVIWSRNDIFNYEGLKYIKSLHQLQNLYFALTNEELTITL